MTTCSGGHDWYPLKATLLVCTKCGTRQRFASAKTINALVSAKVTK